MKHIKTKNRDAKKRSFSLVEFLVACMVVTICAGMCIMGFLKNTQEKKAQTVIRSIEKALSTAYAIAKQTHSEVRVTFSQSAPFTMQMELSESIPVSENTKKVFRCKKSLDQVAAISSRAFLSSTKNNVLIFYHWGARFPQETLEIAFTNGRSFSISLKAYQNEINPSEKKEEYPYAVVEKEKKDLYAH